MFNNNTSNSNIDPQTVEGRLAHVNSDEQPYDGSEGQWAGDGSGMDDLADMNANEAYDYEPEPYEPETGEDSYLDASWEDQNEVMFD